MKCTLIALACLTLAASPVRGQEAGASTSNPEMTRLYDEDQTDRLGPGVTDWSKVGPRDDQRRAATRKLLEAGTLHTAADFSHAAFIFQHSGAPDDYLLAHTLAMVAVAKGDKKSLWIATATLDRYLQNIKQPQIYGTQFSRVDDAEMSQEPYNRGLISDALRGELGVPSLAKQVDQLKAVRAKYPAATKP
ncbi:MAG TPA: hypothetical protein VN158_01805 [Caulobacter sp.]|nr:hypothetical protein [Caulobacter sp.]